MADFTLSQLSPQTFWSAPDHTRDRPVLGAFRGQHATLLVDAGASAAHAAQMREALAASAALLAHNPSPLRYVALTHWHWDHVFGLAELGLPAFAHVETRHRVVEMAALDWRDAALDARVAAGQELPFIAHHMKIELTNAQRAKLLIAPPEITFTNQVTVDLGGLTVCILHVGGDHSPDCTVIYSPEERVAFLGDCFSNGFAGTAQFYTLARLLPLHETLERLPVDTYIHGHDPAPQSRAQFEHDALVIRRTGELTARLRDRTATLAQLPEFLGEPLNEYSEEDVDSFLYGLQSMND